MQEFSFGGFDTMMVIFVVIFVAILAVVIGRGIYVWNKNNHSAKLTVEARVVTKRMNVSGMSGGHAGSTAGMRMGSSARTRYFATFELEKGTRLELEVNDYEYGMLAEGDQGKLTFQGTRYLGFERE